MKNALFGVDSMERGILEKVCKSVPFFAGITEKRMSEGVIRGFSGAGLGRGGGGVLRGGRNREFKTEIKKIQNLTK